MGHVPWFHGYVKKTRGYIYIYITWYILHLKYPEGLCFFHLEMSVFPWDFPGALWVTLPWSERSREPREPMDLMDREMYDSRSVVELSTCFFGFWGANKIMILI